ncbi:four-carbon acid sugar kinase family protein [Cohnella hongkongensis]|uniref:Four-carbon acid sugar kinase family protein n=1 Tax=Cohnella hongkongensis TaxID=178337 RepID=A0ABV9F7S1_9BACL
MKRDSGLLLSFYGDDFTGSTDVMEALALSGVPTVLFLEPPTAERLAEKFPNIRAFGVAGISRSLAADEMERELGPVFERLREIAAPIVHYKICSTFDSSPKIGSIGRAIDLAASYWPGQLGVPLLVGVPQLRRYTVFGTHYAYADGAVHRLDRHPTMARHPVTPMDEADIRAHLSRQTNRSIGLMDILDLAGDRARVKERLAARMSESPDVLLYDVLDEERLERAGGLIWEAAASGDSRFVVGSSGIEYALAAHWRETGLTSAESAVRLQSSGPVRQLLAVSGSCSPVTESQIRHALDHGFVGVPVRTERLVDRAEAERERSRLAEKANEILRQGGSPLLYTALGSEDAAIQETRQRLSAVGSGRVSAADAGPLIGEQLGRLTRELAAANRLTRVLVAGGDTSGYVTRELGIYALETAMPLDPGGPLCRGYSDDPVFDGIEIALKGGQVGKADYFSRVLQGR